MSQALKLLTQGQLTEEEAQQVWRKVLEETDIDDDKKLSSNEFSHVLLQVIYVLFQPPEQKPAAT